MESEELQYTHCFANIKTHITEGMWRGLYKYVYIFILDYILYSKKHYPISNTGVIASCCRGTLLKMGPVQLRK